ncbi:MAG: ABC transporter permease [Chloroflexi bacterium]|nr:MAG: ABC transporter permease [Chloroflexota bacterium]MBL1196707.1 ABC transporter permease [Chloroflexota bacterium]NOH14000.1 ABC transporter permease [Chloroflexota bacterium]
MDWSQVLQWGFVIALVTAGIRLAVPVLLAVLGEIITERSGILNLGLEGIMIVGAAGGFMTAYYLETGPLAGLAGSWSAWLGLGAGMLAGMAMGLLMAVLSITLHVDQVIAGVTLVLFGHGLADYFYRLQFSSLTARVTGLEQISIPLLSDIPVLGELLFRYDPTVYLTVFLVFLTWFFLFHTTWGLNIRSIGEHPAATETSGINVNLGRYAATLIGAGLAGLGGATLTVVQLGLFREGITAGRGWIAVALVIFARWRPGLALVGALLFGLADALQFRIQALSQVERGVGTLPYEFLLMLPYLLTLIALLYRRGRRDAPAALGIPYTQDSH